MRGLPEVDLEELFPPQKGTGMIIFDDLMQEVSKSSEITNLLSRVTHHLGLFAICVAQNLFAGGKEQAGQNRNYHYTVLLKNPADASYMKSLGNRWLGDFNSFFQIYKRATSKPFRYLLVDNHPRTDKAVRFIINLLIDEVEPITFFQPYHSGGKQ